MRIFIKISAIIITIVALLVLAATQLISTEDIVKQVSIQVKEATGRNLSVDGEQELSFFPSLSLVLNNVRFANTQEGSRPDMATLEKLNIHIPWLSIFSGELNVDKFVIVNPDILLETSADGKPNWQFDVTKSDTKKNSAMKNESTDKTAKTVLPENFDISLGQVEIQGGKLMIIDHQKKTTQTIDQLNLAVLLPSLRQPLHVSGRVRYMDRLFKLESSVTTLEKAINNQPFSVTLALLSELANVNYEGEIKKQGQEISGNFSISGDSVKTLLQWQNIPLVAKDEAFNQFTLGSNIHFYNNELKLSEISVELDKLVFTGSSTITLSDPLMVNANIDLGILNLNPYLPEKATVEPEKPNEDGVAGNTKSEPLVWDDSEIDLSALSLINTDITIQSRQLFVQDIKLGKNKLVVKTDNGIASIKLSDFQGYEGQGTGSIKVVANKKPYQITSKFELAKINAEPLLTDAVGFDKLLGKGQLAWDLTTRGLSQRDLISHLNGELNFSFIDGAVKGLNLAAIAKSATNIMSGNLAGVSLDSDFTNAEKTDFAALTGTFKVNNGVATTNNVSLNNPFIRVLGAGDIDLPATRISMQVITEMVASVQGQAANEAKSGIKIPIKISGPFHKIKIRPDVSAGAKDKVKDKVTDKLKKLFG
jgi:AsmA protein